MNADDELVAALGALGPPLGDPAIDRQRKAARDVVVRWGQTVAQQKLPEFRDSYLAGIATVLRRLTATPVALRVQDSTARSIVGYVRRMLENAATDAWRRDNPEVARQLRADGRMQREADARRVDVEVIRSERAAKQADDDEKRRLRGEALHASLNAADVAAGLEIYRARFAALLSDEDRQTIDVILGHESAGAAVAALHSQGVARAAAQKRCQRARNRLAQIVRTAIDLDELADADEADELRAFLLSLRDRQVPLSASTGSALLQPLLPNLQEDERAALLLLDTAAKHTHPPPALSPKQRARAKTALARCVRMIGEGDGIPQRSQLLRYLHRLQLQLL